MLVFNDLHELNTFRFYIPIKKTIINSLCERILIFDIPLSTLSDPYYEVSTDKEWQQTAIHQGSSVSPS